MSESRVLGSPVKRREDPALLQGEASFLADISLPGMLHMAILRSPHGHARIVDIDTSAAATMPGVVRVVTGAELVGKIMPLPCIWIPGGAESHFPSHPYGLPGAGLVMATDRVRYIGDPVALVVARTRDQALDALERIEVDYEPLPAVTEPEAALREDAPLLHDEVPKNLNAYCTYGDKEAADKAIEAAEVTVELTFRNQRTINSPIEPRGAIGKFDPVTGDFTLWATTQSPYNHRLLIAFAILGIPYNKLRIISPDIGGSFGTKGYIYPDMPLVLYMSRELGAPIKWVDSRAGLMRSTVQGRDQVQYATLSGTEDGKITGVRGTSYANLGAYPSTIGPGVATAMVGRSLTSVYDIENAYCEVYAVFTNIVPLGAQRGSGRAEATSLIERLIDLYADKIGMDRAEVRRKNLIAADRFPFDNRLGWLYDSGNYPEVFDRALAMIGYDDIAAQKADARRRGKRLGVAVTPFVAVCGVGPSPRMAKEGMLGGTWEAATMRVSPTGEVSVMVGSKPHGQSHETTLAQVAADELGIPVDYVEVLHSDTRGAPFGQGSYGSRTFSVCGPAVQMSARKIKAKIIEAFAFMRGIPADEVIFEGGRIYSASAPDEGQSLQEIAMAIWYGWTMPPGMEPNLEETTFFDPPDFNYPFGAHAAIVEVDEATGEIEVKRYAAVSDVGNVGNPMVVDGQIHGGIAHGIGQALMEEAIFDEQGRLITDSLSEYPLPRAIDLPSFELDRTVTPTPHNDLGAKGAGEVGTVPAAAVISSAVHDALSDLGVEPIDMPFTPEKVWRKIRDAGIEAGR